MDNQYNPADIALDAVKFARSRFGKHYVAHLETLKSTYTDAALTSTSREVRADSGLIAAEYQKTIDYFTTAQAISTNPTLLDKLRKAFKKRTEKPTEV